MRWSALLLFCMTACGYDYLGRDVQVVYEPQSEGAVLSVTGPIVTSRFPETAEASSRNDSSVFVIDLTDDALTYRQFLPIVATYDEAALTVRGPFADATCRAGEYAFAILDNVRDAAADARIGRSTEFDRAFESDTTFAELRLALVENSVELAAVAGATIFTVSCP